MTPHTIVVTLKNAVFQTNDTSNQQHTDCPGYDRDAARDRQKIQKWRTAARNGAGLR